MTSFGLDHTVESKAAFLICEIVLATCLPWRRTRSAVAKSVDFCPFVPWITELLTTLS